MTFSDLEPGDKTLRVIARNSREDRAVVISDIFVSSGSHCAVHLINSGLRVYGNNARVEFATSGLPLNDTLCTVDDKQFSC